MLNRATALLNFADADAQFQRRYCSISPAEALNFNAVCMMEQSEIINLIDELEREVALLLDLSQTQLLCLIMF